MLTGPAYLTVAPWPVGPAPGLDAALALVGADVVARSRRLLGHPVRLMAGRIGHERDQAGAACHEHWRAMLSALDVAPDCWVASGEERHARVVKAVFLKLVRQGDIYKAAHECEDAYLLAASRHAGRVAERLQADPDFVCPAPRREAAVRRASQAGVADPCVARRQQVAGIPVPSDPAFAIEPWFEMLAAYLTGAGYLEDPALFESCWPPETQVVTSDTADIHALAWPAMLAALGLPWPRRLLVRGDAAEPSDADVAALATRFGSDAVRCALLLQADYVAGGSYPPAQQLCAAARPFGERLQALCDTVLAALHACRGGVVPSPGQLGAEDGQLLRHAEAMERAAARAIAAFDFRAVLAHIGSMIARALEHARGAGLAGGAAATGPQERLDSALFALAEAARRIGRSLAPVVPRTAAAIQAALGIEPRRPAPGEPCCAEPLAPGTRVRRPGEALPLASTPAEGGIRSCE